jgi:exodeoxyribonuclease VII small subunit
MSKQESAVKTLSFEVALEELKSIVSSLESGETKLEDSIRAYERGVALKVHCETKLREARSKIEKISINEEGQITTSPLDAQE